MENINFINKNQIVGYIRVSSPDQKVERQLYGLELDKIFTDHFTGRIKERPALDQMLNYVREGDTVIVHSMDRLARNTEDLLYLVNYLNRNDVTVRFIKENLTFEANSEESMGKAMNQLMLTVMAAIAQFELTLIDERRKEGIARAIANGVYQKRKKRGIKLTDLQLHYAKEKLKHGVSKAKIARSLGVTRQTIHNNLHLIMAEEKG